MRFARIGEVGHEVPVVIVEDRALDLRPITSDVSGEFLANDPVRRTADALRDGLLSEIPDAAAQRIGAPIARPGAVVCIGMNSAAHARESGAEPPTTPVVFLKTPNTVVGPDDDVTIPRGSERTDWEVELGVVIGTRLSYVDDPEDALSHVAGFVIVNDLSERGLQLERSGGQWSKGKCAPGFSPTGPWLVTPDEFDHRAARLRSSVNSEPRQDSSTADMIFGVGDILVELSQVMTLDPGDLVLTGTPEGVALSGRFPYLRPGDVAELAIDGLGRQRQRFAAWGVDA